MTWSAKCIVYFVVSEESLDLHPSDEIAANRISPGRWLARYHIQSAILVYNDTDGWGAEREGGGFFDPTHHPSRKRVLIVQ